MTKICACKELGSDGDIVYTYTGREVVRAFASAAEAIEALGLLGFTAPSLASALQSGAYVYAPSLAGAYRTLVLRKNLHEYFLFGERMMKLAEGNGLKTIAFPLISAGVYGYPQREAIKVAVETMKLHREEFDEAGRAVVPMISQP